MKVLRSYEPTGEGMFAEVRVELADGFAEAIEDAVITAGGDDVHVAELLRVGRVVSTPRHDPQSTRTRPGTYAVGKRHDPQSRSNTTMNKARYKFEKKIKVPDCTSLKIMHEQILQYLSATFHQAVQRDIGEGVWTIRRGRLQQGNEYELCGICDYYYY